MNIKIVSFVLPADRSRWNQQTAAKKGLQSIPLRRLDKLCGGQVLEIVETLGKMSRYV